jgi:hypothetical protein
MTLANHVARPASGRIRGGATSLISENARIGAENRVATELAAATAIIKLPNGNGCDGRARAIDG